MKCVPDLFVAGDYVGTTERALSAFALGDLGKGKLVPVEGYQSDEQTPLTGDRLYLLNYGSVKAGGSIPEQSQKATENSFRKGIWNADSRVKGGDIAVSALVLDGPDMWVDDRLEDVFLLSGAIVAGLKKPALQRRSNSRNAQS